MHRRIIFAVICGAFLFIIFAKGLQSAQPEVSGEEIYGWAKAQTEFGPRRPGTDGISRSREHIIGLLKAWGYEVSTEAISFTQYYPREWRLELVRPEQRIVSCYPLWHSGSTGPEGVEADLVYIHKGGARSFAKKDVAGKVVLASRGHRFINLLPTGSFYHSYELSQEKQAAGYLSFFTNTPDNAYQMIDVGSAANKSGLAFNTLPGLSIGKEDAVYLRRLLAKDAVRVRMYLQGDSRQTETYTIIALLPGRTSELIMVDTHYCSTFTGAVDNATGVASALALARYFSLKPAREREKDLLFVFYGSHEFVDCNLGAELLYRNHPELASKILLDIGLDHMAAYPWKEYFGHMTRIHPLTPLPGMDQPRGVFISETPVLYETVIPSLLNYRLVPSFVFPMALFNTGKSSSQKNPSQAEAAMSEKDSLLAYCACETAVSYEKGIAALRMLQCPLWWHTPMDTMDKFSPEQLKRVVDAHILILEKLDRIPADQFRKNTP